MELSIVKPGKAAAGKVSVSDAIFGVEFNEGLVHQVVTSYMSRARQGTKAQKNRSAVSGGGAKPWRQKGTGRARAGTSRGPIWRTGGVTFAASPRTFENKVNRKMYRASIRVIFSELARQDRLVIVEQFDVDAPKTKAVLEALKAHKLDRNTLIVSHEISDNLYLGSRNLFDVGVSDVEAIDPVSLVAYEKVVVTVDALKKIEERLS